MISHKRRFLLIGAVGLIAFSIAQLIVRNFYIEASVKLAVATAESDSLHRAKQALISRIAELETPGRLTQIGNQMGLIPLPLESFILMEVTR